PGLLDTRVTERDRRYPRIWLDEMARLRPEAILLLRDEPYRFSEADRADFVGFPHVPAAHHSRIHVIDGKSVCWYWSRMDESLETLCQL
ncbi:MAG TPA: helical backbone metal receptor, partial [Candidatus Tectomicrobia bacterium]